MDRPAPPIARSLVVSIALFMLLSFAASAILAGATPDNVVVVENLLSSASLDIADHYVTARNIPWRNICHIRCSTNEVVSRTECEADVLAPIRNFLRNPAIADHIDYIVLTKGVPLSADYGYSSGPLSITSILTCISEASVTGYLENPYGPLRAVETAFSHRLYLGGYNLYLVTRLDGYSVEDVHGMIDRSVSASPLGPVLLDQSVVDPGNTGWVVLNDRLWGANSLLMSRAIPTIFDSTADFLANRTGLMGYFSWGSNDPSFTQAAYASNTFVPGSIADTYVSSSGRTFNHTTGGQSLIADLILQGACGLGGNVSEPYTAYTTYPNVLFDRYTKGFNLAESFYAACPMLFWKSVVVGDPLMAPYATIPLVRLQSPNEPLTGMATIGATAADPDGISRVEFYFDGALVGTSASAPYSVLVDTTAYPIGQHRVDVKAVDASTAASQGWGSGSVDVQNTVSGVRVVSDAFPCPDGQAIKTLPKPVTAGTAEMGGSEFYIQEPGGVGGIRVISTVPVQEGDVVTISGHLVTVSGERSIDADSVVPQQPLPSPLQPISMPAKWLGGGNLGPNTRGVTGGRGARNTGLLIRTYGTVTYVGDSDEDFFYADGGGKLADGSGHPGIRIICRELPKPPLGASVAVTGISSCVTLNERIIPVVKVRRQADVRVISH